MKHIVITGATGFVGTALVRELLNRGTAVTALVHQDSDRKNLDGLDITVVKGGVTQPTSLAGLFDGVDGIIHAAGMLKQVDKSDVAYHSLNVEGTRNVLAEVSRLAVPPPLLHISSPGVLGPIETSDMADETTPLAPSTPREYSQAMAEMVAREFARHGLPVIIARPEFIYGPGNRRVLGLFRAVQQQMFFYIAGGAAYCHPTYIDDAVAGLLLALEQGRPGEIYHITGPCPVTFRELAETIAKALQVRAPWLGMSKNVAWNSAWLLEKIGEQLHIKPPYSRARVAFLSENRHFSRAKALTELGYVPQFSLSQGVTKTVAWYQQEGLL